MGWIAYGWIVLVWDSFLSTCVHVDVAACVLHNKNLVLKMFQAISISTSWDLGAIISCIKRKCYTFSHTNIHKTEKLFCSEDLSSSIQYSCLVFTLGAKLHKRNAVFARSNDIAQRYVHHTASHTHTPTVQYKLISKLLMLHAHNSTYLNI